MKSVAALLTLAACLTCCLAGVGPIANEAAFKEATMMLAGSPSRTLTLLGSALLQDTKSRVSRGGGAAAGCLCPAWLVGWGGGLRGLAATAAFTFCHHPRIPARRRRPPTHPPTHPAHLRPPCRC
jgi:hypothetical protein